MRWARRVINNWTRASEGAGSGTAASVNASESQRGRSKGWLMIPPLFAAGLGAWQVSRLQWKLELIAEAEAALAKEPIDLNELLSVDGGIEGAIDELKWRRVSVKGNWTDDDVVVGPRTREGVTGVHVVTGLRTGGSGLGLIVNRGFVSDSMLKGDGWKTGGSGVNEEVIGIVKAGGKSNSWVPDNETGGNTYYANVDELAGKWGVRPVYVEKVGPVSGDEGAPQVFPAVVTYRNNHMEYAVTWFTLSAATAAMAFNALKKVPK